MKSRPKPAAAALIRTINETQLAELEMDSALSRFHHLKSLTDKKILKFFRYDDSDCSRDYNSIKHQLRRDYNL